MKLDNIIQMTFGVGESWAVTHAQRLLKLSADIGKDIAHDAHVLALAAYLHDWGAFARYLEKGVEHALRSRQVVEGEILPFLDLSQSAKVTLL